jgi:hypothetical protein
MTDVLAFVVRNFVLIAALMGLVLIGAVLWMSRKTPKGTTPATPAYSAPTRPAGLPPRPVFSRAAAEPVRNWLLADIAWLKQCIDNKETDHHEKTPEVTEWLFWALTTVVVGTLTGIATATVLLVPSEIEVWSIAFNPQLILLLAELVYVAAGFRAIPTDRAAGLDFAGTPVKQFGNGLKWYPWLVFNLTTESALLVQAEFPGDADHVFWGGEEAELPDGKVRPIYILTGENPGSNLPTDLQTNLGASALVRFQLVSKRYFDLVRNVAPVDDANGSFIRETMTGNSSVTARLLEVLRQLRDTGARYMGEVIGKLSYNEITLNRALLDEWLFNRIKLEMIPWGLELREAGFTQLNPGHDYNKALQQRSAASIARDALVLQADGKGREIERIGEATASARLALLKAEAEGQKKIRDGLGVSGQEVLAADVGKAMADGDSNTVIIGPGLGAAGLGAILGAGAQSTNNRNGGVNNP